MTNILNSFSTLALARPHFPMRRKTFRPNTITRMPLTNPGRDMRHSLFLRKAACLLAALFLASTACKPRQVQLMLDTSHVLGLVLAVETIRAAAPTKQVVLITAV